jgi:tRNA pseudouridine55 synthase
MDERMAVKGLLNVHKPSGMTSRAVVDRVVQLVPRIKVGHAGTLDPLASGVLVVCLGSATRLVEHVQHMTKTYRAMIRLGARSDTLDADGRIEVEAAPPVPSGLQVQQAVASQVGQIFQVPPDYSALRVKGRRAYKLARSGQAVTLQPRHVRVDSIDTVSYDWPRLELVIDCGAGTYIRSIARDVGEKLGCGGLIESLARTRIGPFQIEDAIDGLSLSEDSVRGHLLPLRTAVADLPAISLTVDQVAAIVQGRSIPAASLAVDVVPSGLIALLGPQGDLVALARGDVDRNTIHPCKVLE